MHFRSFQAQPFYGRAPPSPPILPSPSIPWLLTEPRNVRRAGRTSNFADHRRLPRAIAAPVRAELSLANPVRVPADSAFPVSVPKSASKYRFGGGRIPIPGPKTRNERFQSPARPKLHATVRSAKPDSRSADRGYLAGALFQSHRKISRPFLKDSIFGLTRVTRPLVGQPKETAKICPCVSPSPDGIADHPPRKSETSPANLSTDGSVLAVRERPRNVSAPRSTLPESR